MHRKLNVLCNVDLTLVAKGVKVENVAKVAKIARRPGKAFAKILRVARPSILIRL